MTKAATYYIGESWAEKKPRDYWFVVGHVGAPIGPFCLFRDSFHIKAAFPQKYKDFIYLFIFY